MLTVPVKALEVLSICIFMQRSLLLAKHKHQNGLDFDEDSKIIFPSITVMLYDRFLELSLKVNGILQCKKSSRGYVVNEESLSVASDLLLLRDSLNEIPLGITHSTNAPDLCLCPKSVSLLCISLYY